MTARRGSKRNARVETISTSRMRGCAGLRIRFASSGTRIEGTCRTSSAFRSSQPSPSRAAGGHRVRALQQCDRVALAKRSPCLRRPGIEIRTACRAGRSSLSVRRDVHIGFEHAQREVRGRIERAAAARIPAAAEQPGAFAVEPVGEFRADSAASNGISHRRRGQIGRGHLRPLARLHRSRRVRSECGRSIPDSAD